MYSGGGQYGVGQNRGGGQYGGGSYGRPSAPTPITGASPPPGEQRQYLPASSRLHWRRHQRMALNAATRLHMHMHK